MKVVNCCEFGPKILLNLSKLQGRRKTMSDGEHSNSEGLTVLPIQHLTFPSKLSSQRKASKL